MNDRLPEYLALAALAAGVIGITLFSASPVWYINILLLLIFAGVMAFTRRWPDRAFYLVCSGELLVIACTIMSLWAGLFAVWLLAVVVGRALGRINSRRDLAPLAVFCGSSFLVALLIEISNHVIPPLLVLGIITAIILGIQSVRMYQFRKNYTGA